MGLAQFQGGFGIFYAYNLLTITNRHTQSIDFFCQVQNLVSCGNYHVKIGIKINENGESKKNN